MSETKEETSENATLTEGSREEQPYRKFLSECMTDKISEGAKSKEAMVECAQEWSNAKAVNESIEKGESKLYLIETKGCPKCEEAKKEFETEINEGKVKVENIDTEKGWEIIRTLKLFAVPTLVVEKADGTYCKVTKTGDLESCQKRDESSTKEESK